MTTIRRIYVYLLAFAGLAVLTVACANLLQTLLDAWLASPNANLERSVRQGVALWGAAAVVALPMWLAHWLWTERRVRTDAAERASALRRLYLYAILVGASLIAAGALRDAIGSGLEALIGERRPGNALDLALRPLPFACIAMLVWFGHLRIALRDRLVVGEVGGSATLRRWYVYGAALIGFAMLLEGSREVLEQIWRMLTLPGATGGRGLAEPIATALVGLALWFIHWAVFASAWPRHFKPARQGSGRSDADTLDDRRSTLRGVYLFIALAITVFGALLGLSQILYYAVGRLLGVAQPGGVGGDLLPALAGPASMAMVFAAAWLYQRYAISRHAADEHVAAHRLYAYLVALLSLLVFAIGLGGVLWTLVDISASSAWRDQMALYTTAVLVGLPVWLAHWAPRAAAQQETRSLARRLYVYLTLIVAMLALLASGAAAVYRLFQAALATSPEAGLMTDLGHALAIAAVASAIAVYHWRVGLRVDPAPPADARLEAAAA